MTQRCRRPSVGQTPRAQCTAATGCDLAVMTTPARRSRALVVTLVASCAALGSLPACTVPPTVALTRGVSAEEHAAYFPIGDGAVHATGRGSVLGPISCDSCHAGTDSFEQATCLNCHGQDTAPTLAQAHAGVAGFIARDARCLSCHLTGERGGSYGVLDHSRDQFPIDDDSVHGGAAYLARVPAGTESCDACHASVDDRTQLLCAECHEADERPPAIIHQSFASSYAGERCIACHAETPAYTLAQHAVDHVALPHSGVGACRTCHDTQRPEPKPWAIDFAAQPPYAGVSCSSCHAPDGTPTVLDRHDVDNFPIGPDTPHGNSAYLARVPVGKDRCTACHTSTLDPSALDCVTCHQQDPVPPAQSHQSFQASFAAETCQACHATTPAFTLAEHAVAMPLPHSGIATCRSCHDQNRPAPRDEAIDFRAPMPYQSAPCVRCHDGGVIPNVDAHSETEFPIGENDPHGSAAFSARIPAGETQCTSCHVSVDDPQQLRCAECHAVDVPPQATLHAAFPTSFATTECQACHARLPPQTIAEHAQLLPLPHRGVRECAACHATRSPAPRDWELNFKAALPLASPTCRGCHPTSPCNNQNRSLCDDG